MESLKKGGHLVLNISDIKKRKTRYPICDFVNDFLTDIGMEEGDHFGIRIQTRPNTLEAKGKILCEPAWVWRKT